MNYEREREEEVWKKVIWKIKIKWRKHNKIKQKRKTDEEKKTQRATKPHTHRIINKIHSKGRVVNTLCACYIFLGCCSCCCCWCWVLCFFFAFWLVVFTFFRSLSFILSPNVMRTYNLNLLTFLIDYTWRDHFLNDNYYLSCCCC